MPSHKKPRARSFAGIPRVVMDSPEYQALSGNAVKLLLAMSYQYRGKNNGDLTAAYSVMRDSFGFNSQHTVSKALKELLTAGFLIRTRQSQFMNPGRKCALYALTWLAIDECDGKLEVGATRVPPRKWAA